MFSRLLLCLLVLGASPSRSSAGWMVPLSLEELSLRADVVLHATVTGKACERHARGHIITRVQVNVSEVYKGTIKTNQFEFIFNGGKLGNEIESSSIQANYEIGEEAVLFLKINDWGDAVTVGVVQGKFVVWEEKATGEKYASNPFHGISKEQAANGAKAEEKLALRDLTRRAKGVAK